MRHRSLERFFARVRLVLVVVFAWILLVEGLHFAGRWRAHRRLEEEVATRARAAARAVATELGSTQLRARLHAWRTRGLPPGRLDLSRRTLRERDVTSVELLTPEGWGMNAKIDAVAGPRDEFAGALSDALRRRLLLGEPVLDLDDGLRGDPIYAVVSVFQPVLDSDASLLGLLQVDMAAENLARSRRELLWELVVHGLTLAGFIGVLVLFGRWLVRPLRLLEATTRDTAVTVESLASQDDTGFVIETYRRMVEQLQEKEQELRRLREVERHRADELQELNASIVDSMVSGVLIIDLSGRVRSINDVARETLGLGDEPARGRPWSELLRDVPELHGRLERCLTEGAVIRRDETRLALRGTGRRDVGLTLSPLRNAAGQRTGALCLIVDLTEVKRLQEQVRLKASLADLGELSGGIAHEFRNSLGTILGYSRLVERSAHSADVAESARAIGAEVASLRTVVDDFLRFANPTRLVLEPIDLAALLDDLAADVATRAGERSVTFSIRGELPGITGDETLLRRVFTNLLRNAVDAVGDGGRVEVTGRVAEGCVIVDVEDDGPGIPEDERERVFVPFFTKKEQGTGLGLALVRKVVVHHGGTITVGASQLGGARFRLTLPLRVDAPPA